jgi:molybdate transport system substrate-binding protein
VTLKPVSEESKVTDVRTKVESGQADAGIVYVTDAKASGDKVESIAIKDADSARNDYLIGVPTSAKQAQLAAQFIELVKGSRGQEVLKAAGFGQ